MTSNHESMKKEQTRPLMNMSQRRCMHCIHKTKNNSSHNDKVMKEYYVNMNNNTVVVRTRDCDIERTKMTKKRERIRDRWP